MKTCWQRFIAALFIVQTNNSNVFQLVDGETNCDTSTHWNTTFINKMEGTAGILNDMDEHSNVLRYMKETRRKRLNVLMIPLSDILEKTSYW